MAITRTGSTSNTGTGGTSLSVTWPSVTANDLAVAFYAVHSGGTISSGPSGFTQMTTAQNSTNIAVWAYYKVCSGSETGSLSASANYGLVCAWLGIFSGTAASSPLDQQAQSTSGTPPNSDASSVTTTVSGAMLFTAHAQVDYSNTDAATWTPPSGMTEDANGDIYVAPSTNSHMMEVNYLLLGSPGATGTKTAVCSKTGDYVAAKTAAFKPASSYVTPVSAVLL